MPITIRGGKILGDISYEVARRHHDVPNVFCVMTVSTTPSNPRIETAAPARLGCGVPGRLIGLLSQD